MSHLQAGPVRTQPAATLLQVEEFAGPWRAQTNIPGHLGAGFRTSNARGVATSVLRGSVKIEITGSYAVWARGYEGEGMDRSFYLSLAGRDLPATHTRRDRRGFSWQRAGSVDLQAGTVDVVVHDHGEGFETADAVLLTLDQEYDPSAREREHFVLKDPHAESRKVLAILLERCVSSSQSAHRGWLQYAGSRAEWGRARDRLRQQFRKSLGLRPWPKRTPLRPHLFGETNRDGYKVQRLTFESRPGFVVTANLYIPQPLEPGSRVPAVLCPVGHWPHSKAQPVVQARCIGLAKLGFVAMTYDPFGQGERAVPGNGHDEYWKAAPAGLNNMSFMVWDSMRALDYLLSLPFVDSLRVACTGASGGGLNTLYLSAIDDRIKVSVPVVYLTSFEAFLNTRIGHCPCSHLQGLAGFADMGDLAALVAPRPLLAMSARRDGMFTVPGAEAAVAEAEPVYQLYGARDNLGLQVFDCQHDYNKEMREALYGFVLKHLKGQGDGSPFPEPQMTVEPVDSPLLRCYADGKIPVQGETVRSLARRETEGLVGRLGPPQQGIARRRKALRALLRWQASAAQPVPVEQVEDQEEPEKILLRAADGIALPALFFKQDNGAPVVVVCGEEGIQALRMSPLTEELRKTGLSVFLVDVRGWGETASDPYLLATDGMLLGDSLPAQRSRDLGAAVAYLRQRPDVQGPVGLLGLGLSGGMVTLLAAASEGSLAALAVPGVPDSLLKLYDDGPPIDVVVGSLAAVADIAHLNALANCPAYRGEFQPRHLAAWFGQVLGGIKK
ncbi:MAG: acetylxylan esterase [Armatimonadetes bacterium]|nr:acetylxylan esterase [Armatimonadota bacterium]